MRWMVKAASTSWLFAHLMSSGSLSSGLVSFHTGESVWRTTATPRGFVGSSSLLWFKVCSSVLFKCDFSPWRATRELGRWFRRKPPDSFWMICWLLCTHGTKQTAPLLLCYVWMCKRGVGGGVSRSLFRPVGCWCCVDGGYSDIGCLVRICDVICSGLKYLILPFV